MAHFAVTGSCGRNALYCPCVSAMGPVASTVLHRETNWINAQSGQIPRERAKIPCYRSFISSRYSVSENSSAARRTFGGHLSIYLFTRNIFPSIFTLNELMNLILQSGQKGTDIYNANVEMHRASRCIFVVISISISEFGAFETLKP